MKIDDQLLNEICKACEKEEDPIFKQQICLLCLSINKPIDLINTTMFQFSVLQRADIVNNLIQLKKSKKINT